MRRWIPDRLRRRVTVGARGRVAYSAMMLVASVLGLCKSIMLAKILGARALGYYGLVFLVLPLGTLLSNLGIFNALNVELPLAKGRGAPDADDLQGRALGAALIVAGVATVIYVGGVTFSRPDHDTAVALYLAAVATLLATVFEFALVCLRSGLQFSRLGAAYLVRAAAALAATAVGGAVAGFVGAILAEILVLVVVLSWLWATWLRGSRPRAPRIGETTALIRVGVPLMASNAMFLAATVADRYFVAATLSKEQLGQYTFASVVVVAWSATNGIVTQAVGARLLYDRGAGVSLRELDRRLRRLLLRMSVVAAAGFPLLLGVTALLRHGPYATYGPALDVMPILYIGGFLSLLPIYGGMLIVLRRFYLVPVVTVVAAATAVIGGLVVANTHPTLQRFAWLLVVSQAVAAGTSFAVTSTLVRREARRCAAAAI